MTHVTVHVFFDEECKDNLRKKAGREPSVWERACGNGCTVRVFYARDVNGKRWFNSNHAVLPAGATEGPCWIHGIDNPEDIASMLAFELISFQERALWSQWLDAGLREAILSA